jgi:hypothetical protein
MIQIVNINVGSEVFIASLILRIPSEWEAPERPEGKSS